MRILLWHVHGSWTTAFVQGEHEYVLPVTPQRDADGRGRARTWDWPKSVVERRPEQLADEPIDVVLLQEPHHRELAERWLHRRPGRAVPAVYLEHNAPEPHPVHSRHPLADQDTIPIVHVTHFNRLYWDSGRAPTELIEHAVVDPGYHYTGELTRSAVVINDPIRRGQMVGTDLLSYFTRALPIDLFGMRVTGVRGVHPHEDLPQHDLHREVARRRVYLHPVRWTSLGLSVLEAMSLGLPVVGLGATELWEAVPPGTGVVSTDPDRLLSALRHYGAEPEAARADGRRAREAVRERYGLDRFLADWDRVLKGVLV